MFLTEWRFKSSHPHSLTGAANNRATPGGNGAEIPLRGMKLLMGIPHARDRQRHGAVLSSSKNFMPRRDKIKSPQYPMRGMKAKEEYNSPFVEGGASRDPSLLKYPLRGMKLMKKYHRGWGDLQPLCNIRASGCLRENVRTNRNLLKTFGNL